MLPILTKNYSSHPDFRTLNLATSHGSSLSLHAVKQQYWDALNVPYAQGWPAYRAPTGITSSHREQVVQWVRRHTSSTMDPEDMVESFDVRGSRLVSALSMCGLESPIDVLQIDTEGFDDQVLYACDVAVTTPSIIFLFLIHTT